MSRNLFLSLRGDTSGRWREAFPGLETSRSPSSALAVGPGDVVWVAAELPDAWPTVAALTRQDPVAGVVVLSLQPSEEEALRAFDAGARGYCHAWSTPAMLRQVGLVVANGGMWIGADLMSRVVAATRRHVAPPESTREPSMLGVLTEREREVALEVAKGLTNKEVARRLDITERTVKAHLGAIFEKLGARDRLQLVLLLSAAREPVPEGA